MNGTERKISRVFAVVVVLSICSINRILRYTNNLNYKDGKNTHTIIIITDVENTFFGYLKKVMWTTFFKSLEARFSLRTNALNQTTFRIELITGTIDTPIQGTLRQQGSLRRGIFRF